jgi:hypothetical protein
MSRWSESPGTVEMLLLTLVWPVAVEPSRSAPPGNEHAQFLADNAALHADVSYERPVWSPLVLLEVIFGSIYGDSREWTAIFVSLIIIGGIIAAPCLVLGWIRAIHSIRAKRNSEPLIMPQQGPQSL